MKVYKPSNFEVGREVFYRIIGDFVLLVWLPTNIIGFFFKIRIPGSKYTEHILWFWLVVVLLMLFFGFRKFDIRRTFIIKADTQGVQLQYYRGKLYFFQKLIDVQLPWQDIERISNERDWSTFGGAVLLFIENTLYIQMKNREYYTININYCSTIMKTIDKELNEMLEQYRQNAEK